MDDVKVVITPESRGAVYASSASEDDNALGSSITELQKVFPFELNINIKERRMNLACQHIMGLIRLGL